LLGAAHRIRYTYGTIPTTYFVLWREIGVLLKASLCLLLSAALLTSPAFATTTTPKTGPHRTSANPRSSRKLSSRTKSKSHKLHGQQAIDSSRVMEIQRALIREHYLSGDATGNWDTMTQAAMQKYQSEQGWQTRLIPDSRALKKLGLGPDYSGAINAEGASFASPAPAATIPSSQAAGFASASGVNR
jgi:peptidoglycan hydrolase-like protein with peptidoglycan-binding domain